MDYKFLYIPNDDKQNKQNYPIYRLQLVVETFGNSNYKPGNQNSRKVPKVDKLTIKKTFI